MEKGVKRLWFIMLCRKEVLQCRVVMRVLQFEKVWKIRFTMLRGKKTMVLQFLFFCRDQ